MREQSEQLLAALRRAGVGVDPVELADALWLSRWMIDRIAPTQDVAEVAPVVPTEAPAESTPPAPKPKEPVRDASPEPGTAPVTATKPPAPRAKVSVNLPGVATATGGVGGKPLVAPTARALPDALSLLRALRPLMRRVPARRGWEIDEEETVRRVAEQGLWLPAVRPLRERWLRLTLIVDGSASMGLWQQAIREFTRLVLGSGVFRDVQVWTLHADDRDMWVTAGLAGDGPRARRDPREVLDPTGRSVVLLLSDGIGPVWRRGQLTELLSGWGQRLPVALVQLLPEHLWSRTALGGLSGVRLSAKGDLTPSNRLRIEESRDWLELEEATGPLLPILTLEPVAVSAWARLLTGRDAQLPGVLLAAPAPETGSEDVSDARGLLDRFWRTASATARKLAGLTAAAPVLNLPILRLIRHTQLPEALQVHEAEVMLSGLLRMIETAPSGRAEEVKYDFHDGVRELLLDAVPVARSLAVLEKVSEYVEKHLGMGVGFRALLRDPAAHAGMVVTGEDSFARVAAEVLVRLGGDYARLVQTPTVPAPVPPVPTAWFWVTGSSGGYPPEVDRVGGAVGRLLAEEGFGLMTGMSSGVDAVVTEAFVQRLEALGAVPVTNYVRRFFNGEEQLAQQSPNGLIVLHGRAGVRATAQTANWIGSPVLPLASTGGYAEELNRAMWEQAQTVSGTHLTKEELEQLRTFDEGSFRRLLRRLARLERPDRTVQPEPTHWVCVSGTVTHQLSDSLLEAAMVVGRILAKEGFGLQTGGYPGVDYVVSAAFAASLPWRDEQSLARRLRQILVEGQKQEFKGGEVVRVASEREQHHLGIVRADAFISMGEIGPGVMFDREARRIGKPVFPLASTGGDAQVLFEHFLANWEQFPMPGVTKEGFRYLGEPLEDGTRLRWLLHRALSAHKGEPLPKPTLDRNPQPCLKWVLVAGQAASELTKAERKISRTIARILARQGFGLIVRGNAGVDLEVATDFAHVLSPLGPQIVQQRLQHCILRDLPRLHNLGATIVCESESEQLYACLEPCDLAILISGEAETRAVGELALGLGKPVFPIASTGGAAAALYQLMLDQWQRYEVKPLTLEEFRGLYDVETGSLLRMLLKKMLGPGQGLVELFSQSHKERKWVLVCGSSSPRLDAELAEAARRVGRLLAEEGLGLVVGMWPGVDLETARSFADTARELGQPVQGALFQIGNADTESEHILGDFICVSSDEAHFEQAMRRADAVLLLGGRGRGHTVGKKALAGGKPVLPLRETGGDAAAFHSELLDAFRPGLMGSVTLEALLVLCLPFSKLWPELPGVIRLALGLGGNKAHPATIPPEPSESKVQLVCGPLRTPLVIGVLADLSGRPDKSRPPLDQRRFRDISWRNFDELLEELVPPFTELAPELTVERLAATWYGLHHLVSYAENASNVKVRVLDVSRSQLFRDLSEARTPFHRSFIRSLLGGRRTSRAEETLQGSALYERLIGEPFGQHEGEPFGLLIGDFEILPREEDCQLLRMLASLCSLAHAPLVAAPSSASLGLHRRQSPDSTAWDRSTDWQQFRADTVARYVGLVVPCVLGRSAEKAGETNLDTRFHPSDGPSSQHLWINGAWAYGMLVIRAFREQGWCLGAVGVLPELPLRTFGPGGKLLGSPEVVMPPQEASWTTSKGWLAICWDPQRPSGLIPVATSCFGISPAARHNWTAELNHLLTVSQLVRSLMMLAQEQLRGGRDATVTERRLRDALSGYISVPRNTPVQERLLRPLTSGEVELRSTGNPPRYELSISLRLFVPQDPDPVMFTTVATLPPLR